MDPEILAGGISVGILIVTTVVYEAMICCMPVSSQRDGFVGPRVR